MKKPLFLAIIFFGSVFLAAPAAKSSVAVTTYHNDNYRTGWTNNETSLTPGGTSWNKLAYSTRYRSTIRSMRNRSSFRA
jgi:hypothetical protein